MTHIVSRRSFVTVLTAAGAGLVLGVRVGNPRGGNAASRAPDAWTPNAWIRVDPTGAVTIIVAKAEMGQGVFTALPMIVAEELDADWTSVRIEQSPARAPYDCTTGGSDSVASSWTPLRQAGATARAMLIAAAAAEWNVAPDECRTEPGFVVHSATNRRASYGSLASRAAGVTMPDPTKVPLKSPDEFRIVGKPIVRRDLAAKTDGSAVFGIDVRVPGMLVASVTRCPFHGGTLEHMDDTKTRAVRGVRRIVTLDPVRNAGLPARVAVVAADTWAAMKGRQALSITWNAGSSRDLSSEALFARARTAVKSGAGSTVTEKQGDVDAAASGAARVIEQTYEVPLLAHTTMEPMNCTAHVTDSSAELWVPTQFGDAAQGRVAKFLNLPVDAVTVHVTFLGGGFGRRAYHDFVIEAVQIAKAVGNPVKVVWSREEDVQHDLYRPSSVQRIRAALDANGRPITWENRAAGQSNNGYWHPESQAADSEHPDTILYGIPNRRTEFIYVGGAVPIGAWRSVRHSQNVFCIESFMDELAHAANADPINYRLTLLDGQPRAQAVLHSVRELSGWSKSLPKGRGRGVAFMKYAGTYVAQTAEVTVARDGALHVDRIACAFDCGQLVNPDTVRAQIESAIVWGLSAALWGEITIRGGRTVQSNFHDYRVARMADTPVIDVHLMTNREEPSGVGEPGVPCVAPAIANAVYAATKRRIRRLPLGARPATSATG
jgi:isoquinoline 1-oxidoreductase beta subunit